MDNGFPCFLVLVIIAVAMAIAWWNRAQSRDVMQAFASVARWYHGRLHKQGWMSVPLVRIPYNRQTLIDVTIGVSDNNRKCTQATIDWPEFQSHVRVVSHQFGVQMLSRNSGLRMGDADWDRNFTVAADDHEIARTLLSGGVRSAITMLSRIRRNGGVDIRFGDGELVVQKLMVLDQASELSAFVRHALEVFDQALLARSTGIEFIDHLQAQIVEDAKCPVCGDLIEDDLVFCSRCKTPHHGECWKYNGKCATYACGETQFAAPRVAKPR
jgi:hypothetical protein